VPEEKEDLFSGLSPGYDGVGEFYDLFADNSDIPFYIWHAKKTGSPILDIAAGTGRISLALAREGFEVFALDCSLSMLASFRRKLQQVPLAVSRLITIVEANMERFKLQQRFPLIIIPNSFGHAMTTEAQLACLRCVRQHLSEDGLFILDLYNSEVQYSHARFEDLPVPIANGRAVERHGKMYSDSDRKLLRVDLQYIVRSNDGSVVETLKVTSGAALISDMEADSLIRKSGFEIISEAGGFDNSAYDADSSRRILLLRKRRRK